MVTRLIGRKLGMTQIYTDTGRCYPVTIVETGPCEVYQVKTKEKDGYTALQIGFGTRKQKSLSRARVGHLIAKDAKKDDKERKKQIDAERKKLEAPEILKEIPWDGKEEIKVGDKISLSVFEDMKRIDIVGMTKGRGFTGAIKRWNFHRQAKNKQSGHERAPGSLIGGVQGGMVGKVVPGKKMPGHYGHEQVTQKSLEVVKLDKQKNLIYVHGAVPGPQNGLVMVQESHWVAPKKSQVIAARKK